VAFQSGYQDASTFYRAFKKHTGMSPVCWAEAALRAKAEMLPERRRQKGADGTTVGVRLSFRRCQRRWHVGKG
jgi:AraC-like DNA-binding protein